MNDLKCIACKSQKIGIVDEIEVNHPAYNKKSFLIKCQKCTLFFINPLVNEERLSKLYSGIYHVNNKKILDALLYLYNSIEIKSDFKLISRFKKSGRVLDIGAGRGDLIQQFSAAKWDRWVFDPYISREEKLTLQKRIGSRVNNFDKLSNFPKKSFDVIILRNVIEHTRDFDSLIKDSYVLLKNGGIIFIRTPNMDSFDFKSFGTKWYALVMPGHLVFFNKLSIKNMLIKNKLNSIYINPTVNSTILSFFRSTELSVRPILKLFISLSYFCVSFFFMQGGDIRVIAKK